MSQHPLNLAVRFLLELAALVAYGILGWHLGSGLPLKVILALVLVVVAATLWGIFAVKGDRGRADKGPIMVPGWVRLIVEVGIFIGAIWGLYAAGATVAALCFGIVVVLQLIASYDRLLWLAGYNPDWNKGTIRQ
jgi:hypothetical protein